MIKLSRDNLSELGQHLAEAAVRATADGAVRLVGESVVRSSRDESTRILGHTTPFMAIEPGISARFGAYVAAPPRMTSDEKRELVQLGRSHPAHAWVAGTDISRAVINHRTNRMPELIDALTNGSNWFEFDIRMRGGEPVTAHDPLSRGALNALDAADVAIGSGMGVRMDPKRWAAVKLLAQHHEEQATPHEYLMWNAPILGPAPEANANMRQLYALRERFPTSWLSLSPQLPMTGRTIRRVVEFERVVGPPVMVSVKAHIVTESLVAALREAGRVSVWNDPAKFDPADLDEARETFRAIGVDGPIDLRHRDGARATPRRQDTMP